MGKRQAGFTLLEVMVALTVAALVLGAVYGVVAAVGSAKDRLDRESEGFHQARVLFDRLSREICSPYFIEGNSGTFFRGGSDDNRNFFLQLTTTVSAPTLPVAAGISEVRYELRDDADIAPPLLLLVRQERSLLPGGESGKMENRLTGGVRAFRVRFFDGSAWQEDWDTDVKRSLPAMIELYLEIEEAGISLPFSTKVAIPQVAGV